MPLPPLDLLALLWFLGSAMAFALFMRHGRMRGTSLTAVVHEKRKAWMRNMAVRDSRMPDVVLLQQLSAANTFFASTSVILLGGLAAMLGSGERIQALLEKLPYAQPGAPGLFEAKVVFLMSLFIYAFFKFAWAYRLTHYTAIMIGATPIPSPSGAPGAPENAAECRAFSDHVAELAGLSAEHANSGLRTYYLAIAGIAWFLHPALFIAATSWVLLILVRRELFSRSRRAIASARTPME